MRKHDHPVDDIRQYLEPGPIVLVSSAWKGQTNIMTMGWHMVMGEEPSLVGCFIWDQNHSFEMIRKSRECVINVPAVHLAATVVGIGNTSGRDVDKFAQFGLTAVGPSNQGTFSKPAQRRKVGPGDIVIIPPGVYHGFDDVPAGGIDYVAVRPDPNRVLQAGYVHSAIKALKK